MGKFGGLSRGARGGGAYPQSNANSQSDNNDEQGGFRSFSSRGTNRGFPRRGMQLPNRGFQRGGGGFKRYFSTENLIKKRQKHETSVYETESEPDPLLKEPMPESTEYRQFLRQNLVPGTVGTPIQLVSNFYKLITNSNVTIYRYVFVVKNAKKSTKSNKKVGKKVDFTPSLEQLQEQARKVNKIIAKFIEENPAIFQNVTYAFDAFKHSFCTTKKLNLPANEFTVFAEINGKMREFAILLKFKEPVQLSEATDFYLGHAKEMSKQVTLVLDTVLRFIMAKSFDSFLWKFFDFTTSRPTRLRDFKTHEFIRGFISSIHQTEIGLALNLHLQTGCIISKSYIDLVHFVCDVAKVGKLDGTQLEDWRLRFINRAVAGLKIYLDGQPEIVYEVNCVVLTTPKQKLIHDKDGKSRLSMYDLYLKKYATQLKEYPLVKIKRGQEYFLPMEQCRLVEKQFLKKMPELVVEELKERKIIEPNVYFNSASAMVKQIIDAEPQLMRDFGLQVDSKATSLYGRVLPAPKVLAASEDEPFYKSGEPPKVWALICFDASVQLFELEAFLVKLKSTAKQLGLKLGQPSKVAIEAIQTVEEVKGILEKAVYERELEHVELIFFVIPKKHSTIRNTNDIYNHLKHYCDQEYGIVSQCVNSKFIGKQPEGYFESFLQKTNAKLGGENTVFDPEAVRSLPFDSSRTMIVGVDVNHPKPLSQVQSAISVLIASTDANFVQYTASIRVQKKNEEILCQMEAMFGEMLAEYWKLNGGVYPLNVILFRNAVSNSNFASVRNQEIPAIEMAIRRTGSRINLTVIVMQKRTNARFALPLPRMVDGVANYNLPSGTVVDQWVVSPYSREFYLVSQANEHGIARPRKYILFRDDLNLSTDQLQQTVFYLCHNSARTRKVIGSPIVIKYADLCANRSMQHIDAQIRPGQFHSVGDEETIIRQLNTLVKVKEQFKNLLYYC